MGKVESTNKLTKEEIKESVLNYLLEEEQKEKDEIKKMYKTRNTLPQTIYKYLKQIGKVVDEDLLYFPEKYDFTTEEYYRFFSTMVDYLQTKQEGIDDKDIIFENRTYYLRYQGETLKFLKMYGQGTAYILSLADTKEIEGIDVGKYEGWLKYIEEKYKEERGLK